ncbi:MAG TPA: PilX N-terminal domain-containing pilus assembly protein [Usitatibacter sp.]|nr:PilX N-terminal domain-containing pilus assembly protein [Usitatibacter sp.]
MNTSRISQRSASRGRQRGITLFVALILLVMVTLLAVSSFRASNTNLKVVSSMQGRNESVAAAQAAVEQVISSANFTSNPTAVAATPIPVDLNGDGSSEYNVTLSPPPTCLKSRDTPSASLDYTVPADRACFASIQYGQATNICAETVWEVAATTQDPVTQAETAVRQGVSIRLEKGDALNTCK